MRLKLGALMITLLLELSACGEGSESAGLDARFRQYYAALTSFTARAQVTADYGERVYQYELAMSGDLTQGSLEVLSPENIAGAGFSWAEGGGSMSYEGVSLETGALSEDGLSPADAMPMILETLATGRQISTGEQKLDGEDTIYLELANPAYPGGRRAAPGGGDQGRHHCGDLPLHRIHLYLRRYQSGNRRLTTL